MDGTRVPTHQLASLLGLDELDAEDLADVCDDYRLTADQIQAAILYELALAA